MRTPGELNFFSCSLMLIPPTADHDMFRNLLDQIERVERANDLDEFCKLSNFQIILFELSIILGM